MGWGKLRVRGFVGTGGAVLDPGFTSLNSGSSPCQIPEHLRGHGHTHNPKNTDPTAIQARIARNGNFSTGQFDGFFGVFFQKFLFWALYGIPEILRRRKPACLELFGLRIGKWGGVNYGLGVLWEPGGLFWIPALPLSIPGVLPVRYRNT